MKANVARRMGRVQDRLATSSGAEAAAPLLTWLSTPESRQALEAAAAGEAFEVSDDVQRAGLALKRAMGTRAMTQQVEAMTRAELAALVAAAASSA